MKNALIIGGDSTIGAALTQRLKADGIEVHTTSRTNGSLKLDLADSPAQWPTLPQTDVAYLCAAVTGLDACENDPQTTARVNVIHMQALAEILIKQKSYVVFLSTNQVFDGTTANRRVEEPVSPVNNYGKQKAAMEAWLTARREATAVLRLTKVITGPMPIFTKWNAALSSGESIAAFDDLVFAPLPLQTVLDALVYLGQKKPRGIFQLSGPRDVSYYEIACRLAAKLGAAPAKVTRASAKASGIKPQFLPRYGTLQPSAEFVHLLPTDALEAVFTTRP